MAATPQNSGFYPVCHSLHSNNHLSAWFTDIFPVPGSCVLFVCAASVLHGRKYFPPEQVDKDEAAICVFVAIYACSVQVSRLSLHFLPEILQGWQRFQWCLNIIHGVEMSDGLLLDYCYYLRVCLIYCCKPYQHTSSCSLQFDTEIMEFLKEL